MHNCPLTELPAALIDAGFNAPGYRSVYEAARSARIPAKRGINGRWTFAEADLPVIAERLALTADRAA